MSTNKKSCGRAPTHIIAAAVGAQLFAVSNFAIVVPLSLRLVQGHAESIVLAGLLVGIYYLAYVPSLLVLRAAYSWSPQLAYSITFAAMTMGCSLLAVGVFEQSMTLILTARVVQGFAAPTNYISRQLLVEHTSVEWRTQAFAFLMVASAAGLAVGPLTLIAGEFLVNRWGDGITSLSAHASLAVVFAGLAVVAIATWAAVLLALAVGGSSAGLGRCKERSTDSVDEADEVKQLIIVQTLVLGFTRMFLRGGLEATLVVILINTYQHSVVDCCVVLAGVNIMVVGAVLFSYWRPPTNVFSDEAMATLTHLLFLMGVIIMINFRAASITSFLIGFGVAYTALAFNTLVLNSSASKHAITGSFLFGPANIGVTQMLVQNMLGRGLGPLACNAVLAAYDEGVLLQFVGILSISAFCIASFMLPLLMPQKKRGGGGGSDNLPEAATEQTPLLQGVRAPGHAEKVWLVTTRGLRDEYPQHHIAKACSNNFVGQFRVVCAEDCVMCITTGVPSLLVCGKPAQLPAVAIVRIPTKSLEADREIALVRHLEACGVRTFNSSVGIQNAVNKFWTSQVFAARNAVAGAGAMAFPMPDTFSVSGGADCTDSLMAAANALGFPVVMKKVRGHRGEDVLLAASEEEARAAIQTGAGEEFPTKPWLVQQYVAESHGMDVRVLVLGGKVRRAMKRQGAEGKLQSNVHAGGHGAPFELPDEARRLCERCAEALSMDFVGMDLLISHDGFVICEANANANFKEIDRVFGGSSFAEEIVTFAFSLVPSDEFA